MAKVLLIQPNKWGRGITSIWIASHAGALRSRNHDVRLFDCTFYKDWTDNELNYNTENQQYQITDYNNFIKFNDSDVADDLRKEIDSFQPDIIFWSALSSHIHGEGEYVNIQYGSELVEKIKTSAITVSGGLQPTADPTNVASRFSNIDFFIRGESELVLLEIADRLDKKEKISDIEGLIWKNNDHVEINKPQKIISNMD